mmetsp:Transcript_20818/g.79831  ORF Transcript_20818/g.79831 Transcript_20818/m.79831 type:complete len:426 (-) Transcript_20818:3821-5098(-)
MRGGSQPDLAHRRARRLHRSRGLLAAHAVQVGLALGHLVGQRVDRGLHRVQRLGLEVGNRVHGLVDVGEGLLQLGDLDGAGRRLGVDGRALVAQHLAGGLDQIAGGGVQRADLVQHQLLVVQRLRDDDGGAQGRHGRRRRAVHALHQLQVVLADQVQRQIALDVDGQLGEQVGHLLARVEQHLLAHDAGLLGVAGLQRAGLGIELAVQLLADVHILLQPLHQRPEVDLLLLDGRVVAQQFVLAALERFDDGVQVALGALVAVEVVGQLVAQRDHAEDLAHAEQVALARRVQRLDLAAQVDQGLADLRALVEHAVLQRADRPLQHPVGDRSRGLDVLDAHRVDALDGLLELGMLAVVGGDVVDELAHLLVQLGDGLGLEAHLAAGRFHRQRRHGGRRLQREGLGRGEFGGGGRRGGGRSHACILTA